MKVNQINQIAQNYIRKNNIRKSQRSGLHSQRGFSSVELGLTLLIVAALVVAAVLFYQDNVRKTSINTNLQYLQLIAGNAKTTYGARNEYSQVTLAVAVQGHIIPDALRDGTAATATNPFGAAITVVPTDVTGTKDALTLGWPNVPKSQCAEIVTGASGVMRTITVGGTAVKPQDQPLNVALTTTACEATDNVLISFVIGRS